MQFNVIQCMLRANCVSRRRFVVRSFLNLYNNKNNNKSDSYKREGYTTNKNTVKYI